MAPDNTTLKHFTYIYDSMGHITTERERNCGIELQCTYDNQGQLLTAKKSVNDTLQKTYTYTYDTYGNIRTATDGTTSHTYTYGDSDWADLLTAYDGTALTYDAIGNPTSYYNGNSYTMTWRNGRELQSLTKGGKKTSYEYDVDGLRNLKTNADGSYSVYYWLGNLLLAEERHTGNSTRVLVFSYDENNSPIGFQFKTNDGPWYYYLYAKNIQGDIVALYRRDTDSNGNKIATHIANYEYDPWGKILSIKNAAGQDISNYPDNSANVNPLRYRGYYYDNESGFYYLQSRYYDPTIGRFINTDTYTSTGQGFLGYNMFAYCNNNPVNYRDVTGNIAIVDDLLLIGCVFLGSVLGFKITQNAVEQIYQNVSSSSFSMPQVDLDATVPVESSENPSEPEVPSTPDVKYPGDDPTKSPGDDYEWRGQKPQGGDKGGYANKNGKDSWHPDLDHPGNVKPHWDYNDGNGHKWRVYKGWIEQVK